MRLEADGDQYISFESYVRWVRSHEAEQGLIATSRVCHAMELEDERLKETVLSKHDVGQWQLAHFAKMLIEASNDFRSGRVNDQELYLACNYYNNIREPTPDDPFTPEGRREILNNLIRISYTQFPYQMINHRADISRALILFEELAAKVTSEFNVDSAFRALTGLSVREFIVNGFAIWAIVGAGEIPPASEPKDPRLKEFLPLEKQQRFRALVTADYATFRECQSKQFRIDGFERQQFNCLQTYPLIRTQKSRKLVCPVPLLLVRRITRGIYFYLQDAYSSDGVRNDFTTFFGKNLFEPYVGKQLEMLAGITELIPEQNIGSEKTCDWILIEGDAITLIECKSLGLTFRAKAFAETRDVAEDLRKRIIKAVQACERTRIAIAKGSQGLERLKGKSTRNLVVLYDDIFLFNSLLYRELLDPELKELGLDQVPFQICTIQELEFLIPIIEARGLAHTLDEKVADKERATWDIGVYLNRLVSEGVLKTHGSNQILNDKFEELFAGIAQATICVENKGVGNLF